MVIVPPPSTPMTPGLLERILGGVSVVTMLATIPQVVTVWRSSGPTGVSLISWVAYLVAACLWFVHAVRRHDKSMYLACIGWIGLNGAVVLGLIVRR